MTTLWSAREMVEAMEGRPLGIMPAGVGGISIDTRTLAEGDAFFAIKGDRFDGHDFASLAIAGGAGLLVVSEDKLPALGGLTTPMIVVDDVLKALGRLAVAARARSTATIFAVTGSVGKTTTKAMLTHALSASGSVHAADASYNNHWGVPLTLARMPADTRFGVFEIGMNHAGEIRPLTAMVRPHVAVVTTIAAAHLGNFDSLEAIATAKAEIFEGVEPGGAALINRDIDQFETLKAAANACGIERIHAFGENEEADVRLAGLTLHGETSAMLATIDGRSLDVTVGAPGRHIAMNALAALGAVSAASADLDAAARALATVSAQKGRGRRHRLACGNGTIDLIDESYNANPASVRAALSLLASAPVGEGGRRIAVLGDMRELGRFSATLHAEIADAVRGAGVDRLYLAGGEMEALAETFLEKREGDPFVDHRADSDGLADALAADARAGDVVMLKASLTIGFGPVVARLVETFTSGNDATPGDGEIQRAAPQ